MLHRIETIVSNLQGCFSRERAPILTVESGDTIVCRTLDAAWGLEPFAEDVGGKRIPFESRTDPVHDGGHCLIGPIAVRGAQSGQTLEVRIHEIVPEAVGMTWVGEVKEFLPRLGVEGFHRIGWHIDWPSRRARSVSGHSVAVAPFLGVMGVAPAAPGIHSTRPPRRGGGNIDCRELTAGSTLYLPIEVGGALFSFGDGHAAQGDGEVGGTAIECGMQRVELSLTIRNTPAIAWPQADTPAGWLTFGFDENLETATVIALNAMLDLLVQRLAVSRQEALALASVAIDLRVTQIANGTLGVHARLPHDALT